jgi:membrane protein DedA with SNARE-associated domain
MWPAVLLSSSATGLALGLARLKVFAVIPATIVLSLTAAIGGVVFDLRWGTITLVVIAAATILQSSYLIGGLLSEAPSLRAAPRTSLQPDLIRAAQFAIGEELRTQFQMPHGLPPELRTRVKQLAVRYG